MIEIELYQPGKVNATINFPQEWNELLLPELHSIAQSILTSFKTPEEAKAHVFLSIIKHRLKEKGLPKDYINRFDAEDLACKSIDLTEFIYKENGLTKQPYPILEVDFAGCFYKPKKKLVGPEDDFDSLTAGEYEDAEIWYHQFKEDPCANNLAHLATILYREKEVKHLQYDAANNTYHQYNADKAYPKFQKLEPWILYSIFLWYEGCSLNLRKLFPETFTGVKSAEPDIMAFTKCIHAAAGVKNGTRDKVRCTPLKEILFDAEQEIIKANELIAQNEKYGK